MRIWRKSGIALVGGVLLLLGALMLVTPGPGWLVIAAGLAVLATEFEWAQRLLERVRRRIRRMTHRKEEPKP